MSERDLKVRDMKNVYVSQQSLLNADGSVSKTGISALKETAETSNIRIFIKSGTGKKIIDMLIKQKIPFKIITIPTGANPTKMKISVIKNAIETATFAVWVVESDKDVLTGIYNTREFRELVNTDPDATIADGVICKWKLIESSNDWKEFLDKHNDDIRSVSINTDGKIVNENIDESPPKAGMKEAPDEI